jgi:hypothetical protein
VSRSASRSILVVCVVATLLCPAAARAEEMVDNPFYVSWAAHRLGTTATTDMCTTMEGMVLNTRITTRLVELSRERAVIEMSMKMDHPDAPEVKSIRVPLPAKVRRSEASPAQMPSGVTNGRSKPIGRQNVKVAGRTLECIVWEFTGERNGLKMTGRIWTSDKVPGQVARMQGKGTGKADAVMTVQLTSIAAAH